MPTGYTAMIEEDGNTNAREFVRKCAREFMPFIHMREEPLSNPPRLPDENWGGESTYRKKALEEARAKLAEVKSLTQAQAREKYEEYVARTTKYNEEAVAEYKRVRELYLAVATKINRWEPHPDAARLKEFCIEQIDMCIPKKVYTMPIQTFDEWLQSERKLAQQDVDYNEDQIEKERERYKGHRRLAQLFLDEIERVPE